MSEQIRINRIDTRQQDVDVAIDALRQRLSPRGDIVSEAGRQRTIDVFGAPLSAQQVVQRICEDVQENGVEAVIRYNGLLDNSHLEAAQLRATADELREAHAQASPAFLATIRRVRENIMAFQRAILHEDVTTSPAEGVRLQQRYVPLQRVGVCVPGGAAAYPSTVLMTVVPALAAGVKQIAVVAPPTPFGAYNSDVLATCHELGVQEVYRVGGAQAVAALAFGVDGLPAVDKVVGPGNLFVALAKKFVYGEVDIDSIAGPSEIVVIADGSAPPAFVAADLLAQAEHAPGASILVAWDDELIAAAESHLSQQVGRLSRADVTVQSLEQFGTIIRVADETEACRLTDRIAPEHLHIATSNAADVCARIHNAGATFLGHYSPVAVGDYAAGPSHVLPTGGTARWASGLNSNDFLRSGTVIEFSKNALAEIAEDVRLLADREGLTAHRASIDVRLTES